MDQNAPLTPAPIEEKQKFTLAPVISLLTGLLAHIILTYSFFEIGRASCRERV